MEGAAIQGEPSSTESPGLAGSWDQLPESCLQDVWRRLDCDDDDRGTVRLVCDHWYSSISRTLERITLPRGNAVMLQLPRLVKRYPHLKTLDLSSLSSYSQMRGIVEDDLAQSLSSALGSLANLETLILPQTQEDNFECLNGVAVGCGATLTALGLRRSRQLCPWAAALLASGLPKLTSLDLAHIGTMPGDALAHLCLLSSLKDLDLTGSDSLPGEALRHLAPLHLTRLKLANCAAASHASFCSMLREDGSLAASLTDLDLTGGAASRLGDSHLAAIGRLPVLASLRLTGRTGWSSGGFAQLASATGLTQLDVSGCKWVEDAGLLPLRSLSSLKHVDLTHAAQLTSAGMEAADGWHSLSSMTLRGASKLSDAAFCRHICFRTSLVVLRLKYVPYLGDEGVAALQGLRLLEILELEDCRGITDRGIVRGLSDLPSLERLSLGGCTEVGDEAAAAISRNTKIQALNLNLCRGATEKSVLAIKELGQLRHLDVRGIGGVTDNAVIQLAKAIGGSLETIKLGWCKAVSDLSLNALADYCPHLRALMLYRLTGITDSGVDRIREKLPGLSVSMYKCSGVSGRDL